MSISIYCTRASSCVEQVKLHAQVLLSLIKHKLFGVRL